MLRRLRVGTSGGRVLLLSPKRTHSIDACPFWSNAIPHFTQLIYPSSYVALATLSYSPIGTLALVAIAYNVCCIGSKHLCYTLELTLKDYIQDQQLLHVCRYLVTFAILLGMENVFVEI